MKITSDAEILDIKKVRLLLKNVAQTNPKHQSGWITVARLEEVVMKIQIARQLIQKGCEECLKNENVWFEACRLASPDEVKVVIVRGAKSIPNSMALWLQATKLEHDDVNKNKVLREGLEHTLDSVRLNDYDKAKKLFNRAREKLPMELAIWIIVAKLEEANGNNAMLGKIIEKCIRALQREAFVIDRETWMKEVLAAENDRSVATY
ncbi:hypothetical protein CRYUN_Cryun04dG0106000 [Craigia yunnanensis]